jgi:hypothetical protein
MTNFEIILLAFENLYKEIGTGEKREDGLGCMPVYYAGEEQEYQEHYIKLGHEQYVANLSFNFDENTDIMHVTFTSDDEDDGTDSCITLTQEEIIVVIEKRDLLIKMYKERLAKNNTNITWKTYDLPDAF